MTDSTTAVLLDALCTAYGYTRAEAEEALRYAANVRAVRFLLDSQLPVFCENCGARTGHDMHDFHCARVRAWEDLDHRYGHAAMGLAFDRARPVRPYRPADEVVGRREYLGEFATRDLERGELVAVQLDGVGHTFPLSKVTSRDAGAGRVTLPCEHAGGFARRVSDSDTSVHCVDCGERMPWDAFHPMTTANYPCPHTRFEFRAERLPPSVTFARPAPNGGATGSYRACVDCGQRLP